MQLPTKPRSKKPLLVTILIVVILLAIGVAYWRFALRTESNEQPNSPTRPVNSVDYNPPTEAEKDETKNHKEELINKPGENPPQNNQSLSLTINRVNQAGNVVSLRTEVGGTKNGECTATFTKDNQHTVAKTFSITFEATTATCNGDVPISDFPAGGEWKINVIAKSGTAVSPAATDKVMVNK